MNISKYISMSMAALILVAPVLSLADMRDGHMMMSDSDREKMMKERADDGMPMGMGRGMGMGGGMMLDLDDKQRKEMRGIQKDLRKKVWALKGQIMNEQDALADLYDADTPNAKAIGNVYGKIFNLKRQIIEATVEAGNKRRGVLNKEQREMMDGMRGGMGSGMGPGMGMMGGRGGMMNMMGNGGMMGGCNGMNW